MQCRAFHIEGLRDALLDCISFSHVAGSDRIFTCVISFSEVANMSRSTNPLRFETERRISGEFDDGRAAVREDDIKFESDSNKQSSIKRPGERSAVYELLLWLTRSFAILSVLSSVALLCVGATPLLTSVPANVAKAMVHFWTVVKTLPLSSLPLLLAGSSYIVLQAILRPRPLELLKRLMLGIAFLLWGVVQLMPVSDLATELGNVVIALYVIDLGLMIWTELDKNQPGYVR
jgi:hypothetical protein